MGSTHRARTRLGVIAASATALAAAAVLVVAAPAAAHVHVDGEAVPGKRATLTFNAPNESDTAATTSITVTLPAETPITTVRAQAKPGWEFEVERVELDPPVVSGDVEIASAIGSITWTATGPGIGVGEYDEFVVQLGPIPDLSELALPTAQGYDDGSVVEWSEDGHEAAHPAPVLTIGAGETGGGVDPLALTGLVLGALGLVGALIAVLMAARARRA